MVTKRTKYKLLPTQYKFAFGYDESKLKDDNRNYVSGFMDTFEYADTSKVILEIEEVKTNVN